MTSMPAIGSLARDVVVRPYWLTALQPISQLLPGANAPVNFASLRKLPPSLAHSAAVWAAPTGSGFRKVTGATLLLPFGDRNAARVSCATGDEVRIALLAWLVPLPPDVPGAGGVMMKFCAAST
jgi:hypothetical protein